MEFTKEMKVKTFKQDNDDNNRVFDRCNKKIYKIEQDIDEIKKEIEKTHDHYTYTFINRHIYIDGAYDILFNDAMGSTKEANEERFKMYCLNKKQLKRNEEYKKTINELHKRYNDKMVELVKTLKEKDNIKGQYSVVNLVNILDGTFDNKIIQEARDSEDKIYDILLYRKPYFTI